jgi:nucleoside 2-deoxyribosyltransferase
MGGLNVSAIRECPLCNRLAEAEMEFDTHARLVNCDRCGNYSLAEDLEILQLTGQLTGDLYKLSAASRRATDAGGPRFKISRSNLTQVLQSVTAPRTPFDAIDRIVMLVHERKPSMTAPVGLTDNDWPLVVARQFEEFREFLSIAAGIGYIKAVPTGGLWECDLTLAGWRHVAELRTIGRVTNQAFVAMWFDTTLTPAYTDGIVPALEDAGYSPVRVDRVHYNEKIDDKIIAEIRRSGLVVADFTGGRGGVYYEAGFAQGLGLPVIYTVRKDEIEGVHFDTRQYNHIVWESPADLRERLHNRVIATMGQIPSDTQLVMTTTRSAESLRTS